MNSVSHGLVPYKFQVAVVGAVRLGLSVRSPPHVEPHTHVSSHPSTAVTDEKNSAKVIAYGLPASVYAIEY